jgi:hypothetical protein
MLTVVPLAAAAIVVFRLDPSPAVTVAAADTVQTDLRGVLPSVRVPTLVLHSTDNRLVPVELGREVAALIPGARFVEIPGGDLYGWADPDNPGQDEIEEFLTGHRPKREPERVLATVLFTDIVASTEHAARLGDKAWRELLDRHNEIVRGELERWRGKEVKTLGDGFLATFDGPARAVRCAREISLRAFFARGDLLARTTALETSSPSAVRRARRSATVFSLRFNAASTSRPAILPSSINICSAWAA